MIRPSMPAALAAAVRRRAMDWPRIRRSRPRGAWIATKTGAEAACERSAGAIWGLDTPGAPCAENR